MNGEEAHALVDRVVEQLSEHFDAVQIMVSWNEQSQTRAVKAGSGNWYARQGMAHEFINADIAQEQAWQLGAVLEPEVEGDE